MRIRTSIQRILNLPLQTTVTETLTVSLETVARVGDDEEVSVA